MIALEHGHQFEAKWFDMLTFLQPFHAWIIFKLSNIAYNIITSSCCGPIDKFKTKYLPAPFILCFQNFKFVISNNLLQDYTVVSMGHWRPIYIYM